MTYEEFFERTGVDLETDEQWRQVMREYVSSPLEKDDFCREWLKKHKQSKLATGDDVDKTQNEITITGHFILPKFGASDAELFDWFRRNYGASDVSTLTFSLTDRMGKLDKNDLIQEKNFFQSQSFVITKHVEKLQQEFKNLKEKDDADSQSKLLDIIAEIIDLQRLAEQAGKFAEVFENFISTNARAAEDLRKQKVGGKLKAARLAKGFSQSELGKMIGVTKGTVSTYENGEREPPIKTLILIAKSLQISLDELFELK